MNDEDNGECVWGSRGVGGRGGMEFEYGRRRREWRWSRGGVGEKSGRVERIEGKIGKKGLYSKTGARVGTCEITGRYP